MKRVWIPILLLVFLALFSVGMDQRPRTVTYQIRDARINEPVRIGLVTDLHSCDYGPGQRQLTSLIDASAPDLLLLGGDILDDVLPLAKGLEFLAWAGEHYPSYYVAGNHEYWSGAIDEYKDHVRDAGIQIIEGTKVGLDIGGTSLDLFGLDDPEIGEAVWQEQLSTVGAGVDPGRFSVLLSHRPERFYRYQTQGFDLVLAGHAHGGQWRLPFLINGLFSPDQGFFPAYAGGVYEEAGQTLVVSRGLARESTRVPRVFNRPEYVIVELLPAA